MQFFITSQHFIQIICAEIKLVIDPKLLIVYEFHNDKLVYNYTFQNWNKLCSYLCVSKRKIFRLLRGKYLRKRYTKLEWQLISNQNLHPESLICKLNELKFYAKQNDNKALLNEINIALSKVNIT